ncbi:hypothetical protein FAZ95_36900 [Trinickia violacea]|uniref:Thioesterase family protein n=1 Tax=Trinickia violacea TaxID=2571746 RepID=A0A4V1EIP4_9BURK|nr:hypothetical protein [Trinickia violacea]QCP54480.1 hypothetical protein FAZ95_36900 [Trinickia violacea]
MESLDIAALCERIAVHPPYFSFSKLSRGHDQSVRGTFSPEQFVGHERGAIASAEVGRHLAILGSCAAAAGGPAEMTYYLATKGRLTMLGGRAGTTGTGAFEAVATVRHKGRRSVIADVVANDGEPFAHLQCEYQVLSESTFSRVFKQHYTGPFERPEDSPYRNPVPLEYEVPGERSLAAHSRPLPLSNFAGHFDEYPSWPVAIVADTFAQVRSRLLHHLLDDEVDYKVARLDVDAHRLVPASASLRFEVECTFANRTLSRYIFSARVMWGATLVSEMQSEIYV